MMDPRTPTHDPMTLAVFGDPISHSRSPWIHQAFATQRMAQDPTFAVDYRAIQCSLDQLPLALAAFRARGGHGLNVTLPLKQAAVAHCASLSKTAQASTAVNTLVWRDAQQGWHGDNTDGPGLLNDLDRHGVMLRGKRLLMIGAGGAAAGVLPSLIGAQPAALSIANRSLERAQQLCTRHATSKLPLQAVPLDSHPNGLPFDVVIQATSAGHSQASVPLSAAWLNNQAVVYDLNYGAAHQPVAQWGQQRGHAVHDGLGMLVEQAALSFELWTGWRPDTQPVLTALRQQLNSPA